MKKYTVKLSDSAIQDVDPEHIFSEHDAPSLDLIG